jgi:beta-glucosidase
VDNPKHRALIREVAGQGLVLLKNDKDVLPLKKSDVKGKKIALLGLAKEALIHGGGSASLHAHYRISPWDGLYSAYGDDVEFNFAKGELKFSEGEIFCTDNPRCSYISVTTTFGGQLYGY